MPIENPYFENEDLPEKQFREPELANLMPEVPMEGTETTTEIQLREPEMISGGLELIINPSGLYSDQYKVSPLES